MKKEIIYLITLVLLCISCENKTSKKEIKLYGKRVEINSKYWGTSAILLYEKFLISKSSSLNTKCVISFLNDGRLENSQELFRVGNGTDEFHNIAISEGPTSSLNILNYPNFSNKILSLTQIQNTSNIESIKDSKTWKKYSLLNLPSFRCVFDSFVSLSDSTILVPGSSYNNIGHILSIIDFKNQTLTPLDYWPSDNVKGDSLAKHSVYTDNCRIYGNNNKYLYKCGEERFAFIFSIEDNKIKVNKELYSVLPDYKCRKDGNYDINKRSGKLLCIDTNSENIYALLLELKQEGHSYSCSGKVVEVFDWDGNLVKTFLLDKQGSQIKINKENNTLYLFSTNPESTEEEIWMYNL